MQAVIRLSYKQVIEPGTRQEWERNVWRDSYAEFCLQAQAYNEGGTIPLFSQILAAKPKASSLHYKVGFAVGLYIGQLNNIIPGLSDTLGQQFMPFELCEFTIVESHTEQPSLHRVALVYTTPKLYLLGVVDGRLWLSFDASSAQDEGRERSTFLMAMASHLSISSFQALSSISYTTHF